ncbi:hypothetical protein CNECB9_750011 [Cupriavidus necator]|uniref:DUF2029 domain-containing protein n=1 Tax=Cupriavidus necator TaxID=106590 RepID=A0A1K0IRM8_CUPNE|nr:hypothetical protein CNECB9_750011 [Cupriavidus necator]
MTTKRCGLSLPHSVRSKEGGQFYLPWAYPPMFLLFVMPLALFPFAASYLIFIGSTAAIYIAALIRIVDIPGAPRYAVWLPVVAFPGVHEAAIMGQNSLLTAGLAAWGLIHLRARPVLSGVLIGLLSIKPQLALLFPVALVAGRGMEDIVHRRGDGCCDGCVQYCRLRMGNHTSVP